MYLTPDLAWKRAAAKYFILNDKMFFLEQAIWVNILQLYCIMLQYVLELDPPQKALEFSNMTQMILLLLAKLNQEF